MKIYKRNNIINISVSKRVDELDRMILCKEYGAEIFENFDAVVRTYTSLVNDPVMLIIPLTKTKINKNKWDFFIPDHEN